ncbi:phage capsid protein [Paenibacillus selenitireducens]|uniref:Phage capsid protein n=1 Tax=Paenibacillus selenitireducens TaxID=1324314 RepID=A0A1T2XA23_9BACL|nr:major capsid protein [Paenibacillus selenitireducens]OPA76747.1 phage capsid protein [Paenibacillus selenitireducens]
MSINIYATHTMLAAVNQMLPRATFLRDRYFPTNESTDMFPTEDVLVEYKDGNKKMAPVVMPRKGGITIEREGYTTQRYTPPLVAPQRPLTIDDLNKKGFGENLFSQRTPAQRQAEILGQDLADFDEMHGAREEYIAAQCMMNNGYKLRQYADKYGSSDFKEYEIRFYSEASNPSIYTPTIDWDDPNADIIADLTVMIRMLTSKGLPATEIVVNPDVADTIINNPKIQKLLDNMRINLGNIAPTLLPAGAASIGKINVQGRVIEIISYDEQYENEETGVLEYYIPSGQVILTAPAAGRGLYGAVTQLEQTDSQFHTYMGKRVPKYTADAKGEVRELKVSSRPLFIPKNKSPWVTAKVLK